LENKYQKAPILPLLTLFAYTPWNLRLHFTINLNIK